jgi:hypothetical protein
VAAPHLHNQQLSQQTNLAMPTSTNDLYCDDAALDVLLTLLDNPQPPLKANKKCQGTKENNQSTLQPSNQSMAGGLHFKHSNGNNTPLKSLPLTTGQNAINRANSLPSTATKPNPPLTVETASSNHRSTRSKVYRVGSVLHPRFRGRVNVSIKPIDHILASMTCTIQAKSSNLDNNYSNQTTPPLITYTFSK